MSLGTAYVDPTPDANQSVEQYLRLWAGELMAMPTKVDAPGITGKDHLFEWLSS